MLRFPPEGDVPKYWTSKESSHLSHYWRNSYGCKDRDAPKMTLAGAKVIASRGGDSASPSPSPSLSPFLRSAAAIIVSIDALCTVKDVRGSESIVRKKDSQRMSAVE